MRLLIVGNHNARLVAQVRDIVMRCGYENDEIDITSPDAASEIASRARHEVVVVILVGLDDNLAALTDVRSVTQGSIVAIGPSNNAKLVLRALRGGASEYVGDDNIEGELETALHQLKIMRHVPKSAHGRWISVVSACGGCGTSTIAANLAVALAQQKQKCLLLEVPVDCGDQALLFDVQARHSLEDVCHNARRLDHAMFDHALARHESGVCLLPGTKKDYALSITPQGLRQVAFLARCLFPYTILDLDKIVGKPQTAALVQSDLVLLIIRLDVVCLDKTRKLLDRLDRMGIARQSIRIVVNRYGQKHELSHSKVRQALGMELLHFISNDPATVNSGLNRGVPMLIDRPRGKYSRQIRKLAKLVIDCLSESPPFHVRAGVPSDAERQVVEMANSVPTTSTIEE